MSWAANRYALNRLKSQQKLRKHEKRTKLRRFASDSTERLVPPRMEICTWCMKHKEWVWQLWRHVNNVESTRFSNWRPICRQRRSHCKIKTKPLIHSEGKAIFTQHKWMDQIAFTCGFCCCCRCCASSMMTCLGNPSPPPWPPSPNVVSITLYAYFFR